MKIKHLHILLLIVIASGCSLKRNTSTTRAIQALNTRYNVYFNGTTSYEEGIKNINQSNSDDYSNIINMYAISKHENANTAKPSMDRTIEKCRKAIKLHSIKKKPERNDSKWKDPEYKAWYNQTEFNPAIKDAWLLLGKAEFHKADFLGSVGTFMYIARYYPNDKEVVTQCQLWIARAYAEMGWLYEAEQVVSKIKQDDLKSKNSGLYAAVNADILLKRLKRTEAIPFLELALKNEKDKIQKQRFTYLLAQLYQKAGNIQAAYNTYSAVLKLSPEYEMDFNARINRAALNTNTSSVRKELKKMIANPNNKNYKDQLFYVMGKTYLTDGDTTKAIENFIISADTSTRKGFDKAMTLITLADLYYNKKNYIKAQPRYEEAAQILNIDYEEYYRISKRAETLSELVVQYETVVLQDSLQKLAALPLDKRKEVVQAIIDKKIAEEKAAEEAEKQKQQNENRPQNFDDNFDMAPPLGMTPNTGEWYFYNPNIIKTGVSEFRKKWGTRKLEDNWRRSSKSAVLFSENTDNNNIATEQSDTAKATNSTLEDDKNPEFYLRQIPTSASQIEKSNEEIATALFNMGFIYKDKIEDPTLAIKTFDEFEKRFPSDKRRVETYYNAYMIALKTGDEAKANVYKSKLIGSFPTSKYVEVVSQPDYVERMERMLQEQDELYATTYQAYNNNKFDIVSNNTAQMQQTYPLSELMPKFLFLNALSKAKTGKQAEFETSLSQLIEKYPASDVSSMAKDIVALLKQGKETKTGSSHSTLNARRTTDIAIDTTGIKEHKFIADKSGKHRILIIFAPSTEKQNKLLFNIASYNFTRFMVKDFDLITTKMDSLTSLLSVTNFESYDEAEWYLNSISGDVVLSQLLSTPDVSKVIISEPNYNTMFAYLGLQAYQNFLKNGLNNAPKPSVNVAKTVAKPTIAAIEKKIETKPIVPQKQKTAPAEIKKEIPKVVTEQKTAEPAKVQEKTPVATLPAEPKVSTTNATLPDNVVLFKNLFGYIEKEPHYISINVLSGNLEYDKVKAKFDAFNAKNYSMLNLKLRKESFEKQQIILIGPFEDANIAKSYLLRIVKEKDLYIELEKTDYRNLLGSQRNLNIMMQNNAMDTYFEFMQQYYLK